MLEKQMSDILAANLRRFIRDLNGEQLKISLWSGDLVLRDVQLQPDILDQVALVFFSNQSTASNVLNGDGSFLFSLGDTMEDAAAAQALLLPFTVVKGGIRELSIRVPWSTLDSEPVSVEVRGVELVFGPLRSRPADPQEEEARLEVMKQRHLGQFERERDAASAVTGAGLEPDTATAATAASTSTPTTTASSLGSAIAAMSFVEQLKQTIMRNIRVSVSDVSILYVFDYAGLHHSLAAAVSIWVEEIHVTTTDEDFQPRFVMDLAAPLCKSVSVVGMRVGVHARRHAREEPFSFIAADEVHDGDAGHTSLAGVPAANVNGATGSPTAAAAAAPSDDHASSTTSGAHAEECSGARRDHFFARWEVSETVLEMDSLRLHWRLLPGTEPSGPTTGKPKGSARRGGASDGNSEAVPAHLSLAVTLGSAVRSRLSFGAVLAMESVSRSLRDGLVGAPFRPWLHLLDPPPVEPSLAAAEPAPPSTPARRRWAFAIACVRDVVARPYLSRHFVPLVGGRRRGRRGISRGEAMVRYGRVRREYCGLWQRCQGVPWLPPLDTAERQQMVGLERALTLEQTIFLRCLAYAELSVQEEANRHQQALIALARSRKLSSGGSTGNGGGGASSRTSSGTAAGKGVSGGGGGGGLMGWLRRSSKPATEPATPPPLAAASSSERTPDGHPTPTVPTARPLGHHLAAEWAVGQRFLLRQSELRGAVGRAAASPTSPASAETDPPPVEGQPAPSVGGGDEGGLGEDMGADAPSGTVLATTSATSTGAGAGVAAAPPFILHVCCRRVQVTFIPRYWDSRRASRSFLSHLDQHLTLEARGLELFSDTVQAPREDRASVSFFVASASAWFGGTFTTPLLQSRERTLPPPQGREDFMTLKENATHTRRTLVVSPVLLLLRPFHELSWWATELVEFVEVLAARIERAWPSLAFRQSTMLARGGAGARARPTPAVGHPVSGAETNSSVAPSVATDITVHGVEVVVPLFAHDVTPSGWAGPSESALAAGPSTGRVARQSSRGRHRGGSESALGAVDESDEGSSAGSSPTSSASVPLLTSPGYSWNDVDEEGIPGSGLRDACGGSFVVGPAVAGRGEWEGAEGGARHLASRLDAHHCRGGGGRRRSRPPTPPRLVVDDVYVSGEPCLVLSVPALRAETLHGAERRYRGCESRGQEVLIVIGDQSRAMRLFCQPARRAHEGVRKLEMVSLSVIQMLINPSEVAVGVYYGAEFTVDPLTFAMLNDALIKPVELYSTRALVRTSELLERVSRVVGDEGRAWCFPSSTALQLDGEPTVTLPPGQGREYATLLYRWWLARRLYTGGHPAAPTLTPVPRRKSAPPTPPPHMPSRDYTLCVEFVRVVVRNARQEDVVEVELMVPDEAPGCTTPFREAFSVFSHVPHAVEVLARVRPSQPAPVLAVLSVPDTTISTAAGKPLSSMGQLSVTYMESQGCWSLLLDKASVFFEMEVAESIETVFGVVRTFERVPLPPLSLPAPSLAVRDASPSAPLEMLAQVGSLIVHLPLSSQSAQPCPTLAVTASGFSGHWTRDGTGAITALVKGRMRALRLEEDVLNESRTEFPLVGPSTGMGGERVDFTCTVTVALPPASARTPGDGSGNSGMTIAVRAGGGHVCVHVPFMARCVKAVEDPLYARLIALSGSATLRHGLSQYRRDPLGAEAAARSPTPPPLPSQLPAAAMSFVAQVTNVEVLLAADADLPVDVMDESTYFYLSIGHLDLFQRRASRAEEARTGSTGTTAAARSATATPPSTTEAPRRRLCASVSRIAYAPSTDHPPVMLPCEVTMDVDVGVLLAPRADLTGYDYVPSGGGDVTMVVSVDRRAPTGHGMGALGHDKDAPPTPNGSTARPSLPTVELVLPPSRVAVLMRVVLLNLGRALPPLDEGVGAVHVPSAPSTPRRPTCVAEAVEPPFGGEAVAPLTVMLSDTDDGPFPLSHVPSSAEGRGGAGDTLGTPPPPAPSPAVAMMVTLPSLRVRLFTEDRRVFSVRVTDGIQYCRIAGRQWERCPAHNIRLSGLRVDEEEGALAPETQPLRGSESRPSGSSGTRQVLLAAVTRIGATTLTSADAAPVCGGPSFRRFDCRVEGATVMAHILPWASLTTMLHAQWAPVAGALAETAARARGSHTPSPDASVNDSLVCPSNVSEAAAEQQHFLSESVGPRPRQVPGASLPDQTRAPAAAAVVVLTEAAVVMTDVRLVLVRSSGEADARIAAAMLHLPCVELTASATSDDSTRADITLREPPTFALTASTPGAGVVFHGSRRASLAGDVHFLEWVPLPLSESAKADGYVTVTVTTRARQPWMTAAGRLSTREAAVGELILSVPVPQTAAEVRLHLRGLRVQCGVQPSLSLADFVCHDVVPLLKTAAALRRQLRTGPCPWQSDVAGEDAPPTRTHAPLLPPRTVTLVRGTVEDVRVRLHAPWGPSTGPSPSEEEAVMELVAGRVQLSSGLGRTDVVGLGEVAASVPLTNASVWAVELTVDATGLELRSSGGVRGRDAGVGSSSQAGAPLPPVLLPSVCARVSLPMPHTTFMEVAGEVTSPTSANEAAPSRTTVAAYVHPPPSIYARGRVTFRRVLACELSGAAAGGPALAISAEHVLAAVALARAVASAIAAHGPWAPWSTDRAAEEPTPSLSDPSHDFTTRTDLRLELRPGLSLRFVNSSPGRVGTAVTTVAAVHLVDPVVVEHSEGTTSAALLGRFELVDGQGAVALYRRVESDDGSGARLSPGEGSPVSGLGSTTPPSVPDHATLTMTLRTTPDGKVMVDVGMTGIMLHWAPATVDLLASLHDAAAGLRAALTRARAPDETALLDVSAASSLVFPPATTSVTAPAVPPPTASAPRTVTAVVVQVRSVGVSLGGRAHLIARGLHTDLSFLFRSPALGGPGTAHDTFQLDEVTLLREDARGPVVVFAHAGPVHLSMRAGEVEVCVRRATVTNQDGYFLGDLLERALRVAAYVARRLCVPLPPPLDGVRPSASRFVLLMYEARLCLRGPSTDTGDHASGAGLECTFPSVTVRQSAGPGEWNCTVTAEGGSLVAQGDATSGTPMWTIAKGVSVSVSAAGAGPALPLRRTLTVQLGPLECALPLGPRLQRSVESAALLLLQFASPQRFLRALTRDGPGGTPRQRRRLVLQHSLAVEGSNASSVSERVSAPSSPAQPRGLSGAAATLRVSALREQRSPMSAPDHSTATHVSADSPLLSPVSARTIAVGDTEALTVTLHAPLVAVHLYREPARATAGGGGQGAAPSVVCGGTLHEIALDHEVRRGMTVRCVQVGRVTGVVARELQEEFVAATAPDADAADAPTTAATPSRSALYARLVENRPLPSLTGEVGPGVAAHVPAGSEAQHRCTVTVRAHGLRLTLSPALLHILTRELLEPLTAGVVRGRGALLEAALLSSASGHSGGGGPPDVLGAGGKSQRHPSFLLVDALPVEGGRREGASGSGERGDEALVGRGSGKLGTWAEGELEPASAMDDESDADDAGAVLVVRTSLCLQHDLALGGPAGIRLHFRKPFDEAPECVSGRRGRGSSGSNVLTIKSVNHARLLLSMIELPTRGLQYAPIVVDEGLTVRVEDTPVVLDGGVGSALDDYVVLGSRSLFAVPEHLLIRLPALGRGERRGGADTAAAALAAADATCATTDTPTLDPLSPARRVLREQTDVSVCADMRLQLWSGDQTLTVLAEASARYHAVRTITEERRAVPTATGMPRESTECTPDAPAIAVTRTVTIVAEAGDMALRNVTVLSDCGPVTAAPATLAVSVQLPRTPESPAHAGVTVIRAILPAVRLTISVGHLRLLRDVVRQLRVGAAHVRELACPRIESGTGMGGRRGWSGTAPAAMDGLGQGSGVTNLAAHAGRLRRRSSTSSPTTMTESTTMTTTTAVVDKAAMLELGVTLPSVELVVTNDFFKPEVTLSVTGASAVVKAQRDGGCVSCVATGTVTATDHPLLEPPRTLLSLAPELTVDYLSLGDGSSLKVAVACAEVAATLPLLSALRVLQYDLDTQSTGAFAFHNALGIPLILRSSTWVGHGSGSPEADGGGPPLVRIPAGSTVRPDVLRYNHTRFRIRPGDAEGARARAESSPALLRSLLLKSTEVDVSALQKGATSWFPLVESDLSPSGVMDTVLRLDEDARTVSITSAVRLFNDLVGCNVALPDEPLTPLVVPPGGARYVTLTALQRPFCILVGPYSSDASTPPMLSLAAVISAFLLQGETRAVAGQGSRAQQQQQQQRRRRLLWNHAALVDSETLVMPVSLTAAAGLVGTGVGPATEAERGAPTGPRHRVVNVVLRKRIAREGRPRPTRLLPKYEVEMRVQPAASLVNLTGANLTVTLFIPAGPAGVAGGVGSADTIHSDPLAPGQRFDWYPGHPAEAAFAPHVLLQLTVGDTVLRSTGPVELSRAAAESTASRVIVMTPVHVSDGPVARGAALVLDHLAEFVLAVRAIARLENRLPYAVRILDPDHRAALVGRGLDGVLEPGASHPVFLALPADGGRPSATAALSVCVAVVAGRPASAGTVRPSPLFPLTAPTLSALLSSEEGSYAHYFTANLTHAVVASGGGVGGAREDEQEKSGPTPTAVMSVAPVWGDLAGDGAVLERVVTLQPAFVMENAHPTLSLVVHAPGLSEAEALVVPPRGSVEVVDMGLPPSGASSTVADPEVTLRYVSYAADWVFGWTPPVRLVTLAAAAVAVTVKHRLCPLAAVKEGAADGAPGSRAEREAAGLVHGARVSQRPDEPPQREWYASLTLAPSTRGAQSLLTVGLAAHAPLVVENRTAFRVQYEQRLLTSVGGALVSPTSSLVTTALSSAAQPLWAYVVEPYSDATAAWDVLALEAPAVQLTVMLTTVDRRTGVTRAGRSVSCLVDLHKVAASRETIRIADGVFAFAVFDHHRHGFFVTLAEDRALESKLVFQSRRVAHVEVFVRDVSVYVASVCVPAGATSLHQTRLANLARRQLLNVYNGVTPQSSDAEVLAAVQRREFDLFLVRVSGIFAESTWNERHVVAHLSVARVDVLDCTAPQPVYPLVLQMAAPSDEAVATPCFSVALRMRMPSLSHQHMGDYETIRSLCSGRRGRSVGPLPRVSMERFLRGGEAASGQQGPSRETASAPLVSTALLTVPIDELRIGFSDVTLRLHDSFLYAVRQAASVVLENRAAHLRRLHRRASEWSSTGGDGGDVCGGATRGIDKAGIAAPTLLVYDVYITHLRVSRVALNVTVTRRVDGKCNPFAGLPMGSLAFPSVEAAPLALRPLSVRDIHQRHSSLARVAGAVLWPAYRTQAIVQACKLLGSLDALGNPMALLGGWARGVRSLVQGTVEADLATGARSFVREAGTSTLRHVGLLSRLGGRTLAALTRTASDEDWLETPEARDAGVLYGLARGVTSAVGGAVGEPFEGARSSGVRGFVTGVSKGMVGLLTKPMAGFLYSVGSAADLYAQVQRGVPPAELHLQYLGSDRNFPPAVLTEALPASLSPSDASQSSLVVTSATDATTATTAAARTPTGLTGAGAVGSSSHRRSTTGTTPVSAGRRGVGEDAPDFLSAQAYARVAAVMGVRPVRGTTVSPATTAAARRLFAEVGPHNVALHAPYEDFWRFSTPEEFYDWFPVALAAHLGRTLAAFAERRRQEERAESAAMARGAQHWVAATGPAAGPASVTDSTASRAGSPPTVGAVRGRDPAGTSAAALERARTIKATLGVRTLLKYVTLEQLVHVCSIEEMRANISPDDLQLKCGLLLMQCATEAFCELLSLHQ